MKMITIIVVIVVLGCGLTLFSRHGRAQTKAIENPKSPNEVFEGLRNQALGWSRKSLGVSAPPSPTQAWGIVMDWVVLNGAATIVAVSDGSASI